MSESAANLHATGVSAAVAHVVDLLEAHAAQIVAHVEEHRAVRGLREHRPGAAGRDVGAGVARLERDERSDERLAHLPGNHLAEKPVVDVVLVHREVGAVVLHASGHDQHRRIAVLDHVAELGLRELLDPHGVDAVDRAGLVRRRLPSGLSTIGAARSPLRQGARREQRHRQQNHQLCPHHVSWGRGNSIRKIRPQNSGSKASRWVAVA